MSTKILKWITPLILLTTLVTSIPLEDQLSESEILYLEKEILRENQGICGNYNETELQFTRKQIYWGHQNLTNFMSWARVHPDNLSSDINSHMGTISWIGLILLIFPLIVCLAASAYSCFIMTFYFMPRVYTKFASSLGLGY